MILENIYQRYMNSRNIKEKQKISTIIERIQELGYHGEQVYASFGEDAAAIQVTPESNDLILITTDAILPEFILKSPFGAGFSAIYVGIDDIMACGGTPIACSTIVTYNDKVMGDQIFEGILEATNRFRIPLVRGHTTTDSSHLSLSSTVFGTCKKEHFLSALGAQENDGLAIIWDSDGEPAKANPEYWNTITNKNTTTFYQKRAFLKKCIQNHYFNSCKDISNGGILGTLYQMLYPIKKGGHIDLNLLESHLKTETHNFSMEQFLFLFLTSAFLVSFDKSKEKLIQEEVQNSMMKFYPIGSISSDKAILLKYKNDVRRIQVDE